MPSYKVVGTQPVLDHAPGETFEANIPRDQLIFLFRIGAIEAVTERKKNVRDVRTKHADDR